MRILFVLFIVLPILEMWLLIEVGSVIGAPATIGLVLLTAVIGAALLRQQGLSTLLRVNQKMEQGQLPATEIIEGIMLAVGGALLLTPGFVTDAVGFACLLPWSRRALSQLAVKRGLVAMMSGGNAGSFHYQHFEQRYEKPRAFRDAEGHTTIEGECRREDER